MRSVASCLCVALFFAGRAHAEADEPATTLGRLWDPVAAEVHRNDMPEPAGLRRVTVHRAVEGELQFLSGPCIEEHRGRLFACWTNAPRDEGPDHECVRGRWSSDGGATWGPVEVAAGTCKPAASYGHGTIFSHEGRLWVFASRMLRVRGERSAVVNVEAMLYDDDTGKWGSRGQVAGRFWAVDAPKPRPGGGWIVGGDRGVYPGEGPAAAVLDARDPTRWRVIDIPFQYDQKKDDKPPYAIETTLWTTSSEIVALTRTPYRDIALMSISRDGGDTWAPLVESNFPMAESRAFAGTLTSGQRYLVCNSGNRQFLILGIGRPGAAALSKCWMIRKGLVAARWPTHSKKPQWSYPWAVEHAGTLCIAYAAAKEDCELAIVPLASLRIEE